MRSIVKLFLCALMFSQSLHAESKLAAEFRREGEHVVGACGGGFQLQKIPMCAYTLFTDHPLHIAAGSMPPQNGFGLGAAFVTWKNTPNWRINWNADAVGATSGAWRFGSYVKLIHTPKQKINVSQPGARRSTGKPLVHPYTVFNIYTQSISLNHVQFFGSGNDSSLAGETQFGMRETIVGGSVIKPVYEVPVLAKLNFAVVGEVNGRFVNIRSSHNSVPSIETVYNDVTAPGLSHQPGFVQFGEGVRIRPTIGDRFQFDYLGSFQQFVAPSDSTNSFRRWTVDLNHTLGLYRNQKAVVTGGADNKGPDTCVNSGEDKCPEPPRTRNIEGAIGVRFLISESATSAGSAVPFYFQPTLGGQDLNSTLALGSYRDYRFRAPNILLLQESIEHSIWGPFGAKLMADQGRVALTRGDLGFNHLRHSFAGGLTLRAGAFPMVSLMFAWGGREGHHNILSMNSSLLGSSGRPPLY